MERVLEDPLSHIESKCITHIQAYNNRCMCVWYGGEPYVC